MGADVSVRHISFTHKGGDYRTVIIDGRRRRVEVTVSPTGRSVQVYVDGQRWTAA